MAQNNDKRYFADWNLLIILIYLNLGPKGKKNGGNWQTDPNSLEANSYL